MNEITIQGIPSFFAEYTGRPITFPSLSVFCDGTRLTETADYTVIYYNNTEPGIASLAIMGTGTYDFRKDILFTIIRTDEDPGREAFRAGPFSDISVPQSELIRAHDAYLDSGDFQSAARQLDRAEYTPFRAETLNTIQENLKYTQEYLLIKKGPEYYEYSAVEPAVSSRPIWEQEYGDRTEGRGIYGVEVDFMTNTFTRLCDAAGKAPGAGFDLAGPFSRRRCALADDGTVTAYFGDPLYTEDGSIGQVMVEQPAFYYRMEPLALEPVQDGEGWHLRKARWYVSSAPWQGFKLHPDFRRNHVNRDRIYLSAYEGCLYDASENSYILDDAQTADFAADKLSSIAGAKPVSGATQKLTRSNARKLAANRGRGWGMADILSASATQLLMLIEYASFDMQSAIGEGDVHKDSGSGNKAEITGATAGLGNHSGAVNNQNNVQIVSYRGEENLWGSMWMMIDGINIHTSNKHGFYLSDHDYEDDTAANYTPGGFTFSKTDGKISAFGYSETCDWLFIPSETAGHSKYPVGDIFYQTAEENGWLCARLGGRWSNGADGGPFCWALTSASSNYSRHTNGRLLYVPQTQ